ncbi:MAG: AMP-binding protein [Acidimicrobiia bacterium]
MPREPTTVLGALATRLDRDPDGPYLDISGEVFTARDIDELSNRCAHVLGDLGVGKGDRVASLLENVPEQVVTFFATAKLGAIAVPVNTAYKGEFLRHQLTDCGARVIVIAADLAGRLSELGGGELPDLEAAVTVGPADAAPTGISGVATSPWAAVMETAPSRPPAEVDVTPADLACLVYTAGTTGPSKGCMLPHNYVVSLGDQVARAWGRQSDDIVWTPLPLFHFNAIAICVVGTLVAGGSAAIARRFSVTQFWSEVRRTGATMLSLLGPLAIMVQTGSEAADAHGHSVRLMAAAPLGPETDRYWREVLGIRTFSAGFGLTEASLLAFLPAGETNAPGAAGRVNRDDFEVRIVDDTDEEVDTGSVGEIVARPRLPNTMFAGYWNRPDAFAAVTSNLWFHTGDLARVDHDGFLYFVDRKKDYLRRRGENISSFELEKTFLAHDAVRDVAVHAVPSDVGEDDVKVTVVLDDDADVDEETLCRWSAERLPYFAVPRYVEFRAELPRNPVGRVLKYTLRDEGVTAATWDRESAGFDPGR